MKEGRRKKEECRMKALRAPTGGLRVAAGECEMGEMMNNELSRIR